MNMFQQDPLTKATAGLLRSAEGVTKEVTKKKDVILKAEQSIKEAQDAINIAKKALSL